MDSAIPKNRGTAAVLRRVAEMGRMLAPAYLLPPAVHVLYQPLNEAWTVKRFGCGCPPLDLAWRFNANHINGLLWLGVFAVCGAVLFFATRRRPAPVKAWTVIAGVPILFYECLWFWARECWL